MITAASRPPDEPCAGGCVADLPATLCYLVPQAVGLLQVARRPGRLPLGRQPLDLVRGLVFGALEDGLEAERVKHLAKPPRPEAVTAVEAAVGLGNPVEQH